METPIKKEDIIFEKEDSKYVRVILKQEEREVTEPCTSEPLLNYNSK